jgi:hypothetical protein
VFLASYNSGLAIGFVFLGLGSAALAYVWLQSRFIPRAFAAWGIFASLLLSAGTLAIIVFPSLGSMLGLTYMMPLGIYEVGLGLWLLIRGIRTSPA